MRLFLAVDPDEAARERLDALRTSLEQAAGEASSALRWVTAAVAHITLHFLGEVDRARLERLVAALGSAVPSMPFDVALGAPEVFPVSGPPRVVWMAVERGRTELAALHRETGARLEQAGFAVERRPYTPHLTLARVRDRRRAGPLAVRLRDGHAAPVGWRVDRATLFESDLSGRAPCYRSLHVIGLGSH
ncbi:MAG: RNA 2',3'-cyclic phosphodiesterase [Vicinamibacterales bacterium]